MKKWKIILPVIIFAFIFTGCSNDKTEVKEKVKEEQSEEVKSKESNTYLLSSEAGDVGIEITIPGEFQETEYLTESWLALEVPGNDDESSTQLMMYLESDETIDMQELMLEEVNYLLSANLDNWEPIESAEYIYGDNCEWGYINYSLDGLEGYKMWTELKNGAILAGTVENIGNNPKPVNIGELIEYIDGTIVTD